MFKIIENLRNTANIKIIYMSFVLYAIINIPLLGFINGIFWDDWVLFNTKSEIVIERFKSAGTVLGWAGYYHNFFMDNLGAWSYKALVFLLYPINGLLFFIILSRYIKDITANVFIFLIYLIAPFFLSKYAAINSPYVFLVTFFLIGWVCLRVNKGWISIPFFLISFSMASLLVIYLFPVAEKIIDNKKNKHIFNKKCLYLVLILLPIIYFYIKNLFFLPYGAYKNYNNIDLTRVIASLDYINRTFDVTATTLNKFNQSITLSEWSLIAILIFFLSFTFSKLKREIICSDRQSVHWILCIFLIFASVLSVFPYIVVSNNINFYYGFESRNMAVVLFPLSALLGLFLYYLFSLGGLFHFACAVIVTTFVCFSFSVTNAYRIDWIKNSAIIESIISTKDALSNSFLIVVDDKTSVENVEQRKLSHYEYSGIFKYSLSRNGLHVTNEEWWNKNFCYKKSVTPHLTSSEYNNTEGFESRSNNFVTRVRFIDSEKNILPIFRLMKYKVELKLETNLDWCSSVCQKCEI
jgi:hypothetical protein